jgi:hypothetical protein
MLFVWYALATNKPKTARFQSVYTGHYTDYAKPTTIINKIRGSCFLVHTMENTLHVTALIST